MKTILKLLAMASLCFFANFSIAADCDAPMANGGTKPNQKTLGAGALLRLKPRLKKVIVLENGFLGTRASVSILAYAPDIPLLAKRAFELFPNQELRTLSPVDKSREAPTIAVEILPSGEKAVMYWVDVYNNASQITAGEPLPNKKIIQRILFPNAWQRGEQDALWAQGQTAWGRPKANVGQIVWTANHSRVMGRGSVGELIEVQGSDTGVVKTLDGKRKSAWYKDCVPLTEEEIAQFR